MKILFVSHTFPYPPDEGIKMPVFNLLKEFRKSHSITLLSFITGDEKKYIEKIKELCDEIITIEHLASQSIIKRAIGVFFNNKPYCVQQFFSRKMLNTINLKLQESKFDLLFFDFVNTAIYRQFVKKQLPSALHLHDAMSMLFYRNSLLEKNYIKRFYWHNQYKKLLRFENKLQRMYDKITVVSGVDKKWLIEKSKISPQKVEVIPNGVDTDYFKSDDKEKEVHSIIFRGVMSFQPNIDACLYFIKNIFPLIKKEVPEVKFYIVGPNPPNEIKKFSSSNIVVTGYVDDIREFMSRCSVNVAPMVSGSGIKNKILEAMAMEKPTVATSIACEGTPDVIDSENILIADTPGEFAKKVVLLLQNEVYASEIGRKAREFVVENYSWEIAAKKFTNLFEDIKKSKEVNKLTIIIPAYNEQKTIEDVLERVLSLEMGVEKEVIVVDDGSTDGTKEILERLKVQDERLKVIYHGKNQGKGVAIKTALKNATGDVIAIQDADLEYNPQELKNLIQPLILKKADVVYGSRFISKNPVLYWKYFLGNKFLSLLISILYGQRVTDSYTCYKLFRKCVVENIKLFSNGFEIEAELTCRFLKEGHKILELPISYRPRSLKEGKKINYKDALIGVYTILRLKFFN